MTVKATTTGFICNIQGVSKTTSSYLTTVLWERVDQHRCRKKRKKERTTALQSEKRFRTNIVVEYTVICRPANTPSL